MTQSEFENKFRTQIVQHSSFESVSYNSSLEFLYERFENGDDEEWQWWLEYIATEYKDSI